MKNKLSFIAVATTPPACYALLYLHTHTHIRTFDKLIDKHNRLRCTNNKFPILVCSIHFYFKKNVQDGILGVRNINENEYRFNIRYKIVSINFE